MVGVCVYSANVSTAFLTRVVLYITEGMRLLLINDT